MGSQRVEQDLATEQQQVIELRRRYLEKASKLLIILSYGFGFT